MLFDLRMCAVDQSRVQAIDGAEAIKIDFNAIVRFSKRNTSQRESLSVKSRMCLCSSKAISRLNVAQPSQTLSTLKKRY